MSYHIDVENQQKSIPITKNFISKAVKQVLIEMSVQRASLSVVVVTNRTIHAVNKRFLHHDYATDVISFDLTEAQLSRSGNMVREIDGEIYVSAVMAKNNAKRFGTDPHYELMLYLVHGILHLLGYDDHGVDAKKKMKAKEKEILKFLEEY